MVMVCAVLVVKEYCFSELILVMSNMPYSSGGVQMVYAVLIVR